MGNSGESSGEGAVYQAVIDYASHLSLVRVESWPCHVCSSCSRQYGFTERRQKITDIVATRRRMSRR